MTDESASAKGALFMSTLQQRVAQGPNRATGDQWQAYVRALVTRGVSSEEIRWSGVLEWLSTMPDRVSKDQVLAVLERQGVKLTEVVKGHVAKTREADRLRVELDARGFTVGTTDDQSGTILLRRSDGMKFVYDNGWDAFIPADALDDDSARLDQSPDARDREADALGRQYDRRTVGDDFYDAEDDPAATRYARYRQPGGENYREVLLTLPAEGMAPGFDVFQADDGTWGVRFPNAPSLTGWRTREAAQRSQDRQVGSPVYRSPHWSERNVVVHIRLTDRQDDQRRRVLFVEEIQSDWAQEARREGFMGERTETTGWTAAAVDAAGNGPIWRVFRADGTVAGTGVVASCATEAIQALAGVCESRGVPRAPFIQSTDAWLSLALKKVLQIAAEGDYSGIAFVSGQQAVDLYGLETIADQIDYDDQTANLVINDRRPGRRALTRSAAPAELASILGEELSQRLLASPSRARGFRYSTRADGLKLGGQGMRVFYDSIVPTAAKDMLKRLGAPGITGINIPKQPAVVREIDFGSLRADLRVASRGDMSRAEFYDNWPELRGVVTAGDLEDIENRDPHNRNRTGPMITGLVDKVRDLVAAGKRMRQPGFDVTPALRERIQQGLPLFSLASARAVNLPEPDPVKMTRDGGFPDQEDGSLADQDEEETHSIPRG